MNTANKQKGMATIIVSIIILTVITLMVVYASRVGLFDQRMSANQARYKEAFAIAEAGLDMTSERYEALFSDSNDVTNATVLANIVTNSVFGASTAIDGTAAVANEPYFTSTIIASGAVNTVVSTGVGADGTGTATIQRSFTMASGFGGTTPDVPVIVGGSVGTGGNFNIVANPNGGGEGVPISVWTGDSEPNLGVDASVEVTSSSATCHFEFYDGNNPQCSNPSGNAENISRGTNPATSVSSYDPTYPDILPNDDDFPEDLFDFMFGIDRSDWQTKQTAIASATSGLQVVNDCTSLVAAGTSAGDTYPFWWINGDCDINGGGTIGSEDKPVVIIISDGLLKVTGGVQMYGVMYLFDNPSTVGTPSSQLNGTTEIIGTFVSEAPAGALSGSYSVVYNPDVIDSFVDNGSNYAFAWVPGSWRDF
jgi:Tfp pilus assembly protein PilX